MIMIESMIYFDICHGANARNLSRVATRYVVNNFLSVSKD